MTKKGTKTKLWRNLEIKELHNLKENGYSWEEISEKLNRTSKSCQSKYYNKRYPL
jgi:hypothetical protein